MIDTIVLTLRQNMFTIIDHDKFSPSTKGLYDQTNYYRLGSRSNMVCKQNPTQSELRVGIYKPRLTITKRFNEYHQFEIMMKVEFSIPKLLFGNNFDELDGSEFNRAVVLLKQKLKQMGVFAFEHFLINAPVSSIHYSKNIPLTDYSTPYSYLEKIYKTNINEKLDLNQTDFRNEGHSLKYRANSFEIAFYDKLKDLDKAKISEKRAEEEDNALQLNLFETIKIRKPFEVLRMEVRLNKKQKLIQILKRIGITYEPTFQSLFKRETAQKILLHYLDEIEQGYPSLLAYTEEPKDFLTDFIINNPKTGLRKTIQMLGLRTILGKTGIREFREITKRYGNKSWYRLYAETKKIRSPKVVNPFAVLRNSLEDFKPLKLVDFQSNMLNNDKYN